MDVCSIVQATYVWVVLCLVLTATGGGGTALSGRPRSCKGECLHRAAEIPASQSSPSRERRQTVEARDPPSHRVPCTRAEKRQTACINGQCFALDLGELRNPFCQCPAKWEGDRCEALSLYYFLSYSAEFQKAMIIGAVVIGIIIIIVVISIYCSFKKGKKKRKAAKKATDTVDGVGEGKDEGDAMMVNGDSRV
ncbi:epigen-like [Littorina saxatilis]|uniref:EGF-like domain-containing protein n=1 Tax=Littorina saxatilis TaxID=31220 RepID=A0AAN9BU97_9CAEN